MKLRLAAPALLVDLRKVPGLHGISRENGNWRIGAMTATPSSSTRPSWGWPSQAAARSPTRRCATAGTIGGSLAHGDPASDLPGVLLAAEGTVTVQGPDGQRTIAAADLFQNYMETAIGPTEVLTEIHLPTLDGWGHAYQKFNRRSEDWAMVAVSALVKQTGDICEDVRIGLDQHGLDAAARDGRRGGASRPAAERRDHRQGVRAGRRGHRPAGGPQRQRRVQAHLARVLCRRALEQAAGL